jgi:hypothetical protein
MLKHWRAVLGVLFFVKPIWEGIKWLLDWLGRADLIASYLHAFGVQVVIDFVLNPPGWTVWPTIGLGCLLIWWDVKRKEAVDLSLEQKLRIGFYCGCTALAATVWGMYFCLAYSPPARALVSTSTPAPKPILPPPRVTQATPERAIYKCKRSPDTEAKTEDARFAEFKKYIEVYSDMNGYAAKVTVVPGGRKAELTPATPFGAKNMGNALKMSVEVRTIGKDLLGIFTAEYSANVWAGYLLPEGSETETRIRKRIEDLVGANPGDCELQ